MFKINCLEMRIFSVITLVFLDFLCYHKKLPKYLDDSFSEKQIAMYNIYLSDLMGTHSPMHTFLYNIHNLSLTYVEFVLYKSSRKMPVCICNS